MSTQINVNIAGSLLLQQNRDAQVANRNSNVQKDADKAFAEDVKLIKEAAQLATAQARDGAVPELVVRQETSAQRRGDILLAPLTIRYIPYGSSSATSPEQTRFYLSYATANPPYASDSEAVTARISPNLSNVPYYTELTPYLYGQATIVIDANNTRYIRTIGDTWNRWWATVLPAGGQYVMFIMAVRKISYAVMIDYVIYDTPQTNMEKVSEDITFYQPVEDVVYYCRLIDTTTMNYKTVPNIPLSVKNHVDAFFPPLANAYRTLTNSTYIQTGEYITFQYNAYSPEAYYDYTGKRYYGVAEPLQLMAQGYGLGNFTTANHLSPNQFFPTDIRGNRYDRTKESALSNFITPSIFTYFKGDAAFSQGMPTTWASAKQAIGNAPAPSYLASFPYINVNSQTAPTKEQLFRMGIIRYGVTNPTTPVSDEFITFKKSSPQVYGYQIRVWDWGKSQYCRDQLLSLGFTMNDITM